MGRPLTKPRARVVTNLPPRRWFRFRLSTVLILIMTLAWGMATRPWSEHFHAEGHVYVAPHEQPVLPEGAVLVLRRPRTPFNLHDFKYLQDGGRLDDVCYWTRDFTERNPYFFYPAGILALALATFLAWKAAWAVVERRRRKSAAPE